MISLLKNMVKAAIPPQIVQQKLSRQGTGAVLLTFDDGPHPDITPRVLDLLDRFGARAIFFIPGNRIERAPQLLEEILKRGHQLGNHTYTHKVGGTDLRECVEEIERCQEAIFDCTGNRPVHFRPPCGTLTVPLLRAVKQCRLKTIRWNFDTGEYSDLRDATPKVIAANLIDNITERAIVLSHDDTDKIPEAMEIALPQLADMGLDLGRGIDCLR